MFQCHKFGGDPRMANKATHKIFQENEDGSVAQPWTRPEPVNFYSTQTPAGEKSLMDGTPGSLDS